MHVYEHSMTTFFLKGVCNPSLVSLMVKRLFTLGCDDNSYKQEEKEE